MRFSVLAIIFALAGHSVPASAQEPSPARLNLLVILADQQRFDTIGAVQAERGVPERSRVRTPNLDRLLGEGAYFQNAYTHFSVCGPARTSLLTGRTIEATGIRNNKVKDGEWDDPANDSADKIPLLRTYDQILVRDHGYVAEYHGKWHSPRPLLEGVRNDNVICPPR